jgi:lambda repressor-like predicted transcriptional regulator
MRITNKNGIKGTHNKSSFPEYKIWAGMKCRCLNINNARYQSYGGRGIEVCERWLDFENFIADMGRRPSSAYSIERINNNGNYCKDNCKWILKTDQTKNTRANIKLNYKNEILNLADLSRQTGIERNTLKGRIINKGWSIEKAIETPVVNENVEKRKLVYYEGRKYTFNELQKISGINRKTIKSRLEIGMSLDDAMTIKPFGTKRIRRTKLELIEARNKGGE